MTPSETLLPRMDRIQRNALVVGVIALALSVVGLFLNAAHFWQSYLFAYIFWSGLALGCLGRRDGRFFAFVERHAHRRRRDNIVNRRAGEGIGAGIGVGSGIGVAVSG